MAKTDGSVRLTVEKAGLFTSVQDAGREGYQSFGLPLGGFLDRRSAGLANWLVGQKADAPLLEITLQGPALRFDGQLQIALTGADLSPQLDGRPVPLYETVVVAPGAVLSFGRPRRGTRTYLAINGQWRFPLWLESRSAVSVGGKAWPPGAILQRGDRLSVQAGVPITPRSVPAGRRPFFSEQLTVRVMPGAEQHWFSETHFNHFTSHSFTLSADSNRMGYRLKEALPDYRPEQELISSGIVPGTVQLLPSGCPVILMADAQTTGGYPRIANVLDRDLDDLAQLAPGGRVRFRMA